MKQSTLKVVSCCTRRSLSTHIAQKDFFGIAAITSKDIAGSFKSGTKLPQEQLKDKYQPLIKRRNSLANEVVELDVTFGKLRFDKDNIPKSHGQYEPGNDRKMYDTIDIKQRFVPIADSNNRETVNEEQVICVDTPSQDNNLLYNDPYKIVDVSPSNSFVEVLKLFKKSEPEQDIVKYANKPPLTFYFDTQMSCNKQGEESLLNESSHKDMESGEIKLSGHRLDEYELESSIVEANSTQIDSEPQLVYDPEKDQIPLHELDPRSEEYFIRSEKVVEDFDKSLDEKYDHSGGLKLRRPMKALDYLKNVRAQRIEPTAKGLKHRIQNENPYSLKPSIKLDSMGFRNYKNQVPDWSKCRHIDVLNHLRGSILFHNYDILAVNKPYGIASHDEERSREPFDMNNLMQELAAEMKIEKVYLAHRLDKTTTGVLLFATSQVRANYLNKMFKSDQIQKTYWCITKGVPNPEQAIIDIPIGEYTVAGKVRSCLVPESLEKHRQLTKRYREARRAISEYKVISSQKHAALVEVKPRTGVKHQIRCHMSFGLSRPILGDHKYSHIEKVAPQLLPMPLLNALHLRQAKVRTLPMHLHARQVVIPGAKANGETLFIKAPLPAHFFENLKTLKLGSDDLKLDT